MRQHYRMAGANLLAAIIYWISVHLGRAVIEHRKEDLDVSPLLLAYISPLCCALAMDKM